MVSRRQKAARAITRIVSGASSLGAALQSVNQTTAETTPQPFNVRVIN